MCTFTLASSVDPPQREVIEKILRGHQSVAMVGGLWQASAPRAPADDVSEGFVVRFVADDGSNWVGNFQPGLTSCETIVHHPNGRNYIIITGGQAYVVDSNDPKSWDHFGGSIEDVFEIKDLNGVLFGNGLWF